MNKAYMKIIEGLKTMIAVYESLVVIGTLVETKESKKKNSRETV